MLRFKKRNQIPKKVLVYGLDGTGKSTFAETYCTQNNLKAVCLDVDDTNFTQIPLVEFERSNHIKVKEQVLKFIDDVKDSEDFDTVIIDGVSSLLNLLVSNSKGLKMYGDRTVALNKIINELARSKLNFILVGQIDLETEDKEDISTAVVNINSIVNEKYYCYKEKGEYLYETRKCRVADDLELLEAMASQNTTVKKSSKKEISKVQETFKTANKVSREENKVQKEAKQIIENVEKNPIYKELNLFSAKLELAKLMKENKFIKDNCEEILKCLEVLLNGTSN